MTRYKATWGRPLIVVSAVATLVCLAIPFWGRQFFSGLSHPFGSWLAMLPLVLLLCSALYSITGYTLTDDTLIIHRPGWRTRIPLAGIEAAEVSPGAMRGSLRIFGNGGLYSFTGWYWNRVLGKYQAFVTTLDNTVVLRFRDRRIVVSPDRPDDFVREITRTIETGEGARPAVESPTADSDA